MSIRRRVAWARRGRIAFSAALVGAVAIAVAACSPGVRAMHSAAAVSAPAAAQASGPSAPTAPPVRVCGNKADLTGPAAPPKGAVRVQAGNNASVDFGRPDTTYWFAPGVHTLGTGEYANIDPVSRRHVTSARRGRSWTGSTRTTRPSTAPRSTC